MEARFSPGKWDSLSESIADLTDANSVIVVIVDREGIAACSVSAPLSRLAFIGLAGALRTIATKMEADAAELTETTGEG